jgi:WD repeat-containing protein 61
VQTLRQVAVSNSLDSHIRFWDIQSGQLIKMIEAQPGASWGHTRMASNRAVTVEAWSVAYSTDGRQVATGSHSGRINIFSTETLSKESSFETKGKFLMSVAYVCSA